MNSTTHKRRKDINENVKSQTGQGVNGDKMQRESKRPPYTLRHQTELHSVASYRSPTIEIM